MIKSKVENLICNKDYSYLAPYFYNNPYALRCELDTEEEQQHNIPVAKKRALEIFKILFPRGADAIFFNYWMFDYSDNGDAENKEYDELGFDLNTANQNLVNWEMKQLKFLLEYQAKYRHNTVRDLPTYGEFDDQYIGKQRRNRVVCFRDGEDFDYNALLDIQILGDGLDISFVSFENECILSVYDNRGCDIVFMTSDKMKEFYPKLKPYFLSHDEEEMEKRFQE